MLPAAVAAAGANVPNASLLTQTEAHQLAAEHGIHLEGLAGTQDGIIGALAALGLLSTRNDGRVVYLASGQRTQTPRSGHHRARYRSKKSSPAASTPSSTTTRGNPITPRHDRSRQKTPPNFRAGRIVLFATRCDDAAYNTLRIRVTRRN